MFLYSGRGNVSRKSLLDNLPRVVRTPSAACKPWMSSGLVSIRTRITFSPSLQRRTASSAEKTTSWQNCRWQIRETFWATHRNAASETGKKIQKSSKSRKHKISRFQVENVFRHLETCSIMRFGNVQLILSIMFNYNYNLINHVQSIFQDTHQQGVIMSSAKEPCHPPHRERQEGPWQWSPSWLWGPE